MKTPFDGMATLSEQALLDHFTSLVADDRRTTADMLVAMAEIDERKIWARNACSSMFTFCMERFHMSEQVTAKRLWAARTARRFPVILEMVAQGDLHLGAVHLLARHLTADNHVDVLARARHKSSREVERLVAELAPRPDVVSRIRALPASKLTGRGGEGADEGVLSGSPCGNRLNPDRTPGACAPEAMEFRTTRSQDVAKPAVVSSPSRKIARPVVALGPRRYKIEITVDQATHDKLRSLQDMLGRTGTGRDPAAIISRAIDVLLIRTLSRKAGCTSRPRTMARTNSPQTERRGSPDGTAPGRGGRGRSIPAAVRREVWRRDSGGCSYVDAQGHRCGESSRLEFHHKQPFARGGRHTPENIELRCAAHNQYQADLDFGRSFMDARRNHGAPVRTFPGECRG